MTQVLRHRLAFAGLVTALFFGGPLCPWSARPGLEAAQAVTSESRVSEAALTRTARARFLQTARVLHTRPAGKGVTGTLLATLSDGTLTHDASIQSVNQYKDVFQSKAKTEMGFRDTWRYNVAAYELSLLLGLDMVPVTVERPYNGKDASFTWWVDDVLMDEGERAKKQILSPDPERWAEDFRIVQLFDQLIANVDRNSGNMLIDRDWRVWMIDHTRAFRRSKQLRNEQVIGKCSPALLQSLQALTEDQLEQALGRWLWADELQPLLARRDRIVAILVKNEAG